MRARGEWEGRGGVQVVEGKRGKDIDKLPRSKPRDSRLLVSQHVLRRVGWESAALR